MMGAGMALDEFDELPRKVRTAAAIRVLEILRDENRVAWDEAIAYAQRAPELVSA